MTELPPPIGTVLYNSAIISDHDYFVGPSSRQISEDHSFKEDRIKVVGEEYRPFVTRLSTELSRIHCR
jgi:hypothetical protein